MDCFYAAIEVRDRPHLKGKPVAVGGSSNRGVVATANYEARKFGVKSAIPTARAKKLCPDLIFVGTSFEKYKKESKKIRQIFKRFTEKIEPLGLDEAYLDVTDCQQCDGLASKIALEIRKQIFEETGLHASAGIAPNKFLAKVASDWNKPNGQKVIAPPQIEKFMKDLPVKKIPGVGPVTARKMHLQKIYTCGDLQKFTEAQLAQHFGKWGKQLFYLCRGEDRRGVQTGRKRKSLSTERTFSQDLSDFNEIKAKLPDIFAELVQRWHRTELDENQITGSFVKLKFFDFQTTTLERKFLHLPKEEDFGLLLRQCWDQHKKPIRLLGLGLRLQYEKEKSSRQMKLPV